MSKIVDRIFNTVLTANDATAQEELGGLRFEDGNIYKYVQFIHAVTPVVGGPCVMDGTYNYKVTVDLSGGITDAPAGVVLAAVTENYYGWIQIHGHGTIQVTAAHAAGVHLIPTADNMWGAGDDAGDSATPSTVHKYGVIILETGSTADVTRTALIRCM